MLRSDGPSLPSHVFHQPRQLTPQQILTRLRFQEKHGKPLPSWLADSTLVYSLFSPVRDQLWLSLEEGRALFHEMHTRWTQAKGPVNLRAALKKYHNHEKKPIKKGVLLALGRVCGKTWVIAFPEKPSYQDDVMWFSWKEDVLKRMLEVVIFICVIQALEEERQSGQPIKCYGQDPSFEAIDEEFLQSLGVEAVRLPFAESITDHETFVYAPFINYCNTANALTRCVMHQPCIYLGHNTDWVARTLVAMPKWHGRKLFQDTKEAVERLRAYKEAQFRFRIRPQGADTRLEVITLERTVLHIRKTIPTASELQQPCTESCKSVPPPG